MVAQFDLKPARACVTRESWRAAVILGVMACVSCKPQPVSPSTQFRGRTAKDFCVAVAGPCPFKFRDLLTALATRCHGADCFEYALTPGSYEAKLEDDDGIYFEGSGRVHWSLTLGADRQIDGGIYLENDGGTPMAYIYNALGRIETHEMAYCSYSIQRCDSLSPPPQ